MTRCSLLLDPIWKRFYVHITYIYGSACQSQLRHIKASDSTISYKLPFSKTHHALQINYIMYVGNSRWECFIFFTFIMHFSCLFYSWKKNSKVAVTLNGHLVLPVDFLYDLTRLLWTGLNVFHLMCSLND